MGKLQEIILFLVNILYHGGNVLLNHLLLKQEWSHIVKDCVQNYEQSKWKNAMQIRCELNRFSSIQFNLQEHILIQLCGIFPNLKMQFLNMINLGCTAAKEAECLLCKKKVSDIILHLLIQCHITLSERNEIFYKIVDINSSC